MKNLSLAIVLFFLGLSVNGQSLKLKRADKFYSHLAYKSAGDIYEKLLNTKNESPVMLNHLAMCYYNTNQMAKSAETFAKYIQTESASSDELFFILRPLNSQVEHKREMLNCRRCMQKQILIFVRNLSLTI